MHLVSCVYPCKIVHNVAEIRLDPRPATVVHSLQLLQGRTYQLNILKLCIIVWCNVAKNVNCGEKLNPVSGL